MDALGGYASSSSSSSSASSSSDAGEEVGAEDSARDRGRAASSQRLPPVPVSLAGERKRRRNNADAMITAQRVRPRIEGNWATHVYIQVALPDFALAALDAMREAAMDNVRGCVIHKIPHAELHVSLSRGLAVKIFQIAPLVAKLREAVSCMPQFRIAFAKVEKYTNEDRTRSFLAVDVGVGRRQLSAIVRQVDACMVAFSKQAFYEDPRFHASFAWALGDQDVFEYVDLAGIEAEYMSDELRAHTVGVTCVRAAIGNRHFEFPLRAPART